MKRFVALVSALILAGGMIFAGRFYNGDVQLQMGVGFGNTSIQDYDNPVTSTVADFAFESWHLFRPIELLGVGFMTGGNFGVGESKYLSDEDKWDSGGSINVNFTIGPAVGVYLGNVVRLAATLGLDAGLNFDFVSPIFSSGYLGVNAELQAKFFPGFIVNPVVGWRMVSGFADDVTVNLHTEFVKYSFVQNVLYFAFSFSW